MEIAIKRRNISNNGVITLSFLQYRVNGLILRIVGLDTALKTTCIAFGVLKAIEIAFKRRNICNRTDITHCFLQNRVNGLILRIVGLESALKTACIAFGVLKAIEIAFKRRHISNRTDITHCFLQNRGEMVAFCAHLGMFPG